MERAGILVVTGASGAGKSAAVRSLAERRLTGVQCYYFDRIGVPCADDMKRDFGSPEQWQAQATMQWISKLATNTDRGCVSVLDGQTRPSFVRAALAVTVPVLARIVLLDCSPAVRTARLASRGQPDLATEQMENWAVYLRGQADALEIPVIDTSNISVDETANALETQILSMQSLLGDATQQITGRERRERVL